MNGVSSLQHIGLISNTKQIAFSELGKVSAAIQKQVIRDLGPIWGIYATVDAFSDLKDMPIGYWPIIVRDDLSINGGGAGAHTDRNGHPYALIRYSEGWSLTASHECLEMLCNPLGNRTIAGISPIPNQGRVEFLVEVCDPSEASQFSYTVNGIMVSDFYTPHYFDPIVSAGVRYSYGGVIKKPRTILKGGYLTWHDSRTNHLFQQVFFNSIPQFRDLGEANQRNGNFRALIYEKTPEAFEAMIPKKKIASTAKLLLSDVDKASNAKAKMLQEEIDNLLKKK